MVEWSVDFKTITQKKYFFLLIKQTKQRKWVSFFQQRVPYHQTEEQIKQVTEIANL